MSGYGLAIYKAGDVVVTTTSCPVLFLNVCCIYYFCILWFTLNFLNDRVLYCHIPKLQIAWLRLQHHQFCIFAFSSPSNRASFSCLCCDNEADCFRSDFSYQVKFCCRTMTWAAAAGSSVCVCRTYFGTVTVTMNDSYRDNVSSSG